NFLWRGDIGSDEFNERIYGRELPSQGIRAAPNIVTWIGMRTRQRVGGPGGPLFQKYMDRKQPLSESELDTFAQEFGLERLRLLTDLAQRYPQSIAGYVIGDEPHKVMPLDAANRMLEKHAGVPGLVVENSPHWVLQFAPHFTVLAADWYRVTALLRDPWAIADDLRQMQRKSPQT